MKIMLGKNGNYKKVMYALIMVLLIIFNILLLYRHYFQISFEEVYKESYPISEDTIIWQSTRTVSLDDTNYTNKEIFSVNFEDYDLQKYTYIVSYGHELIDITYSFSEMKNSNGLIFIPKTIFKSEKNDVIYIYRIKKMNVDYDIHNSDRNVYFKN